MKFAVGSSNQANGYGWIGGSAPDPGMPDAGDGRTKVLGVNKSLTVKAIDPFSTTLVGWTKSDNNGEWRIEGISPNGRTLVLFQNETYTDSNGDLLNSFVQDWVQGVTDPLPDVSNYNTTADWSHKSTLNLWSTFTLSKMVNPGFKGTLSLVDVPAGWSMSYENGVLTMTGRVYNLPGQEVTVSGVLDINGFTIPFSDIISEFHPQPRGSGQWTNVIADFQEATSATSLAVKSASASGNITVPANTIIDTDFPGGSLTKSLKLSGTGGFLSSGASVWSPQAARGFRYGLWMKIFSYPVTGRAAICAISALTNLSTNPSHYHAISLMPNGTLQLASSYNFSEVITYTPVIPLNEWTHVYLSAAPGSSTATLFINGIAQPGTVTLRLNGEWSGSLLVGDVPDPWAAFSTWVTLDGLVAGIESSSGSPQQEGFIPRTVPFLELATTEILSDFEVSLHDHALANWTQMEGSTVTFNDGVVFTPGAYIQTSKWYQPSSGTFEFYFRPTNVGVYQSIGGLGSGANTHRFEVALQADGKIAFNRSGSTALNALVGTTVLSAGGDYHVCVEFNHLTNTRRIYINGVLEASVVDAAQWINEATPVAFYIGRTRNDMTTSASSTVSTLDATIKKVRFVSGRAVYDGSNFTPPDEIEYIPNGYAP